MNLDSLNIESVGASKSTIEAQTKYTDMLNQVNNTLQELLKKPVMQTGDQSMTEEFKKLYANLAEKLESSKSDTKVVLESIREASKKEDSLHKIIERLQENNKTENLEKWYMNPVLKAAGSTATSLISSADTLTTKSGVKKDSLESFAASLGPAGAMMKEIVDSGMIGVISKQTKSLYKSLSKYTSDKSEKKTIKEAVESLKKETAGLGVDFGLDQVKNSQALLDVAKRIEGYLASQKDKKLVIDGTTVSVVDEKTQGKQTGKLKESVASVTGSSERAFTEKEFLDSRKTSSLENTLNKILRNEGRAKLSEGNTSDGGMLAGLLSIKNSMTSLLSSLPGMLKNALPAIGGAVVAGGALAALGTSSNPNQNTNLLHGKGRVRIWSKSTGDKIVTADEANALGKKEQVHIYEYLDSPENYGEGTKMTSGISYNAEDYASRIKSIESSGGNYGLTASKSHGRLGAYQMGPEALEEAGYIKAGTWKTYSPAIDAKKYTRYDILKNPSNWTRGLTMQSFLANPAMQDDAFKKFSYAQANQMLHQTVIKGGKKVPLWKVAADYGITGEQLLGGAQLSGSGTAQKYLQARVNIDEGKNVDYNRKLIASMSDQNHKNIEDYMRDMGMAAGVMRQGAKGQNEWEYSATVSDPTVKGSFGSYDGDIYSVNQNALKSLFTREGFINYKSSAIKEDIIDQILSRTDPSKRESERKRLSKMSIQQISAYDKMYNEDAENAIKFFKETEYGKAATGDRNRFAMMSAYVAASNLGGSGRNRAVPSMGDVNYDNVEFSHKMSFVPSTLPNRENLPEETLIANNPIFNPFSNYRIKGEGSGSRNNLDVGLSIQRAMFKDIYGNVASPDFENWIDWKQRNASTLTSKEGAEFQKVVAEGSAVDMKSISKKGKSVGLGSSESKTNVDARQTTVVTNNNYTNFNQSQSLGQ
jgi:hypothetical protein